MTRTRSEKAVPGLLPPVAVGDLHLDKPIPPLNDGGRASAVRLLVWLHGRPLTEVVVPLAHRPLNSADLASLVWPLVAEEVAKHCADDGVPQPGHLSASGLPPAPCPARWEPARTPPVTVVVATRDRTDSLLRCLASLARLDYPDFDVVVVESAPSDDTTKLALAERAWPFPLRRVSAARPGLAHAHNTALAEVTGEFVAITDDDVEVDPGWLSALARAFEESGAACVTGLILPAELETPAQLLVEESGGFGRGFSPRTFSAGMAGGGPLFPFTPGRFGSGANMAFRTAWLRSAGGFDPATGAGTPAKGGDDLVAFLKVITGGAALRYEPAAVLRHWHRREDAGLRRQAFGYGVGLGAYLTAAVWARPALAVAMARRVMPALRHLLDPASAKNEGRSASFPRSLVWRERAGVLLGPAAYARSHWRYRHCGLAPSGSSRGTP